MIPCKECLIYPVCKNKKEVRCSLLINWMSRGGYDYMTLILYLPNWTSIISDDPKDIYPTRAGPGWDGWNGYKRIDQGVMRVKSNATVNRKYI